MAAGIEGEDFCDTGEALEQREIGARGKAAGMREHDDWQTGPHTGQPIEMQRESAAAFDRQ
jgi:hypothetical protein